MRPMYSLMQFLRVSIRVEAKGVEITTAAAKGVCVTTAAAKGVCVTTAAAKGV